jgi:hypothetical protein
MHLALTGERIQDAGDAERVRTFIVWSRRFIRVWTVTFAASLVGIGIMLVFERQLPPPPIWWIALVTGSAIVWAIALPGIERRYSRTSRANGWGRS